MRTIGLRRRRSEPDALGCGQSRRSRPLRRPSIEGDGPVYRVPHEGKREVTIPRLRLEHGPDLVCSAVLVHQDAIGTHRFIATKHEVVMRKHRPQGSGNGFPGGLVDVQENELSTIGNDQLSCQDG